MRTGSSESEVCTCICKCSNQDDLLAWLNSWNVNLKRIFTVLAHTTVQGILSCTLRGVTAACS